MIDQPRVGIGEVAFASSGDLGLNKARVTQCALSRICSVCAKTLSRPLVFVGTSQELAANGFHLPPAHRDCAEHALRTWAREWPVSLGQARDTDDWVLLSCSGFDFVRSNREDTDRRAVFQPNSDREELPLPW